MKGQYFSFDAIVGGVIFILTIMALFSYWYGVTSTFGQEHELLAREAFRISEMLFTPLSPGVAIGWDDQHLNYSVIRGCQWVSSPQAAFGSGYPVTIKFARVGNDGGVNTVCVWGDEAFRSNNTYRLRRAASYIDEDKNTTLGYVDILIYEPPRAQ